MPIQRSGPGTYTSPYELQNMKSLADFLSQGLQAGAKAAQTNQEYKLKGQAQQKALQDIEQFMPKDKKGNPTLPSGAGVSISPEGAGITRQPNLYGTMIHADQHKQDKLDSESDNAGKIVDKAMAGIGKNLQTTKGTIDALNLGNESGDTAAILNEGQLYGGARGAVAFSEKLDPGHTVPGLAAKLSNVMSGNGNIELPPAIRNNMRELAFTRLNQYQQQYNQMRPGLEKQIANSSHYTQQYGDLNSMTSSAFQPYDSQLQALGNEYKDYMSQKASAMNQQQATPSQPQGSYSPSSGGGLMGWLKGVGNALTGHSAQMAQPTTPTGPQNDPAYQRYLQLKQKAGM